MTNNEIKLLYMIDNCIEKRQLLIEKYQKLQHSKQFYQSRCELIQKVQKYMRDPERQIVCDILANNSLLPDPSGKRYGQDLKKLIDL